MSVMENPAALAAREEDALVPLLAEIRARREEFAAQCFVQIGRAHV